MHDLESLFWVLFWLCIQSIGPNGKSRKKDLESWNYKPTEKLVREKAGLVTQKVDLMETMTRDVTESCQPLDPWLAKLHDVAFPNYQRRLSEDRELYSLIKGVLLQAL